MLGQLLNANLVKTSHLFRVTYVTLCTHIKPAINSIIIPNNSSITQFTFASPYFRFQVVLCFDVCVWIFCSDVLSSPNKSIISVFVLEFRTNRDTMPIALNIFFPLVDHEFLDRFTKTYTEQQRQKIVIITEFLFTPGSTLTIESKHFLFFLFVSLVDSM